MRTSTNMLVNWFDHADQKLSLAFPEPFFYINTFMEIHVQSEMYFY